MQLREKQKAKFIYGVLGEAVPWGTSSAPSPWRVRPVKPDDHPGDPSRQRGLPSGLRPPARKPARW